MFPITLTTRRVPLAAIATLLIVVAIAPGCERGPLLAPSGTFITLIPSAVSVPIDGSAEITAILIEGGFTPPTGQDTTGSITPGVGTPVHNGTVVNFLTTLGRIEPAEGRTQNGRVTVRIFGDGRSGTATITAISGPASQTLEIAIGTSSADRIEASATPQTLPSGGGQSTIQARVIDLQGNALSGVNVSFTATNGNIAPSSARTTTSGTATATLNTTTASEVTVSAIGPEGLVSAKVTVNVAS